MNSTWRIVWRVGVMCSHLYYFCVLAELTKGLSEDDQMKLALEQSMQDSVVEGAGAEEEEASQEQIKLAMEQSLQDSRLAEGIYKSYFS